MTATALPPRRRATCAGWRQCFPEFGGPTGFCRRDDSLWHGKQTSFAWCCAAYRARGDTAAQGEP